MSIQATVDFDWMAELEKTVVHSLTTSFGLDFLLYRDKDGGDVDTVHNARAGVYATEVERTRYEQRGAYDSDAYHKHPDYIAKGRSDKAAQAAGTLRDSYRDVTMAPNEVRNVEHIVSGNEVHNDPGRVLAEIDGVELANQASNLCATTESINKSKKQTPTSEYLKRLPGHIASEEKRIANLEARLASLPQETPEQQDAARRLQDKIRKSKDKLQQLKEIDPEKTAEMDRAAREDIEKRVNLTYYTSSKFLKSTAFAAGSSGLKLGARQALGIVMGEVWLELREGLPRLVNKLEARFDMKRFLRRLKGLAKRIQARLADRLADLMSALKEGVIGGTLASLTTTVLNIFLTSERAVVKIIREMWTYLVQAVKVIVFNPDRLNKSALGKRVGEVLSLGVATVIGSLIYGHLTALLQFPFGECLAAFASALVTGLFTLGFTYFLQHSDLMRKVWDFVDGSAHAGTLKQFVEANAALDAHLSRLEALEFGHDVQSLDDFVAELEDRSDDPDALQATLASEVRRRGLVLPFEIGVPASTRSWIAGLARR